MGKPSFEVIQVSRIGAENVSAASSTTAFELVSRSWTQKITSYFAAEITNDVFLECELLSLTFATGMQDATTFPDFRCFASNHTGNTILLAVGIAGDGSQIFQMSNTGISLGMFVAGCLIFGQTANRVGSRRRLWAIVSSIIQTGLVFAAAAVQYTGGIGPTSPTALAVIGMLAFAAGSQVSLSRGFSMNEITTAMATAAYVDLLIDPNILGLHNRSRNRRVMFLLMLLAGSFAGSFAYSRVGSAYAILLSAVLKTLVTVAFFFNTSTPKHSRHSPVQKTSCESFATSF